MEILKDTKNDFLKRREIQFTLGAGSNPGFENSKKIIAEKLEAHEKNVAIKFVKNNFGSAEFLIETFVYKTEEDKNRIEPKKKEKKKPEAQIGGDK